MNTIELGIENLPECFVKEDLYEDGSVQQIDFKETSPKCGEVLVASSGNFSFVCILCCRRFGEMEHFGEHIRELHMQVKIEDEVVQSETDGQDPLNTNLIEDVEVIGGEIVDNCVGNGEQPDCTSDEDTSGTEDFNTAEVINTTEDIKTTENNKTKLLKGLEVEDTQSEEKSEISTQSDSDKQYVCDVCGRGYVHRRSYIAHIKKAHISGAKPLKMLFDIPALNVPISENTCKYCDEQFSDTDALQVHLSTHTGRKRFVCRYCLKTFSCRTTRLQHLSIHTGERHYKCPHCPKTFSGKSNLTSHIRAHLKIKNYSCDYCDKRFVQSSEKKVHELTHTGEKPHQCEECGQRYPTSNKLNEHLRRHKNIKNYKCEICGKAFYGLNLLKNHMPTHTGEKPFSCNICNQTFPRKKSLKTHKQLHSGEKNYVCNKCGKAFAQFAGLYSHMKTHGEKPR